MATAAPGRADTGGVRHARWRALPREVLLVAAAIGFYFGVRGETVANPGPAFDHARDLIAFERRLGLHVEDAVQEPFLESGRATDVMNWVYIWGHWPVIIAVLAWLFIRHPDAYGITRGAMLLSGAIGLVVFALYPVAPPRLVDPTLVDTVTERSEAYRVLQPPAFTNPYAAMPSLHVGWDLLIGLALVLNARYVVFRVVGVALPAAMALAVVATANHFVLDAVAGIGLVLASLAVTTYVAHRPGGLRVVRLPRPRDPPPVPGEQPRRPEAGAALHEAPRR